MSVPIAVGRTGPVGFEAFPPPGGPFGSLFIAVPGARAADSPAEVVEMVLQGAGHPNPRDAAESR